MNKIIGTRFLNFFSNKIIGTCIHEKVNSKGKLMFIEINY
jgi:hypothetical protein